MYVVNVTEIGVGRPQSNGQFSLASPTAENSVTGTVYGQVFSFGWLSFIPISKIRPISNVRYEKCQFYI